MNNTEKVCVCFSCSQVKFQVMQTLSQSTHIINFDNIFPNNSPEIMNQLEFSQQGGWLYIIKGLSPCVRSMQDHLQVHQDNVDNSPCGYTPSYKLLQQDVTTQNQKWGKGIGNKAQGKQGKLPRVFSQWIHTGRS